MRVSWLSRQRKCWGSKGGATSPLVRPRCSTSGRFAEYLRYPQEADRLVHSLFYRLLALHSAALRSPRTRRRLSEPGAARRSPRAARIPVVVVDEPQDLVRRPERRGTTLRDLALRFGSPTAFMPSVVGPMPVRLRNALTRELNCCSRVSMAVLLPRFHGQNGEESFARKPTIREFPKRL